MAVRVQPQNLDAEKSVLGAILIDKNAILEVAQFLHSEHFYSPIHASIYEAITTLFSKGEPVDILTVANFLKKGKKLEKIGGRVYLTELAETVPTASNSGYYGLIVKDAHIRRSLIDVAADINELGFLENSPVEEILDEAERKLFQIANDGKKTDFVHIKELLKVAYERAEELGQKQNQLRGIPTGFKTIDNVLGGFQESNLIIVAARPSVGKSAFALDVARHAAMHEGRAVGIFSLEMSNVELTDRLIASQVGMNLWDYRMGHIKDDAVLEKLGDVMGQLSEIDLYLDDTPGQTIMEIRTKARRLSMDNKLDMVIVDYLQLIASGRNIDNRVQEVAEISRGLKNLARELHIPVVALSQLSRSVETRTTKTPQLSDLRESGSIEQDADVVIFISRPEKDDPESASKKVETAQISIAKHRNGPTGTVELMFVKEQAKFADMAKSA